MDAMTGKIIIAGLISLYVFPWILCLIDHKFGTQYSCSIFGWHNGKAGERSNDGCSDHAQCSKCGTKVMKDSQGNWF